MNRWQEMEPRSYPKDGVLENGNYENICAVCDKPFYGHKKRQPCKECANKHNKASFERKKNEC